MAKIQTKVILVKFSKLVKDGDTADFHNMQDLTKALEEVAQEMCGTGTIAEVEMIDE
jgi:hypothetical protein